MSARKNRRARPRAQPVKWRRRKLRHGFALYELWIRVRQRCEDPANRLYPRYGAKGIRLARAWQDFDAFYDWALRRGYAPGLRLVRRDPRGRFEPRNCRWATASESLSGKRRPVRSSYQLRAFGERKGLTEWARDRRCQTTVAGLFGRIKLGWPVEEAITAPPHARASRHVTPLRPQPRKPRKRLVRVDWGEARRLYVDEELSERELAEHFGTVRTTIAKGLDRIGVRRRPRSRSVVHDPKKRWFLLLWRTLHARCYNRNDRLYPSNGARGVRLCREWQEPGPFIAWARASGGAAGLQLARKDRKRGYTPGNCEWITRSEGSRRASRIRRRS